MDSVVFGAGSLGSLIGGLLTHAHEVTLIGRRRHVEAVRASGLEITGLRSEVVHPDAHTEVEGLSADLAIVTVKSYDTAVAARALQRASFGAVCSLQNGLGNEEILAESLDVPIVGGSATYGADRTAPGVVEMTGEGTVTIGRFRGGDDAQLTRLVDAFEAAGIVAEATDDIRRTLWRKLAINAAINPVTALARTRNGALVDGPLKSVASAAGAEVVAVANEHDVGLDRDATLSTVFEVAAATGTNRSSMLQDVLAEQRTEIDAINGVIVDRARDVAVPVNATLAELVIGWERGCGLRD
ncbi:MAG: ketopantoate reductase family protein [Halobacteriota archaeon]